jgi:hypothetical protein
VKGNKETYANVSRSELAELSHEKQAGLFVSFSPEQKIKIYQEKYQYLMELNTLSKSEKEYLTKLFQQAKPEIYSSEKEKIKFEKFADEWTHQVQDLFGWYDIDVFRYTHTWLTIDEFNKWFEIKKASSKLKSMQAEVDCDCRYDIGCIWGLRETCVHGNCIPVGNCGILGTADCTGVCQ